MDEIVRKAMEKWPNVPHCYGWLMLDARGAWRMRDEATQAASQPGDRIAHEALLAFINRNYACDERGCWFFQNGPQRVYVNLEATPFIVHTDAQGAFQLHTGEMLMQIDAGWFTDGGQLLLRGGDRLAQVDDRDLVECLPALRLDGMPVDDARLLQWVEAGDGGDLTLLHDGQAIRLERIASSDVAQRFGFVRLPVSNKQAPHEA